MTCSRTPSNKVSGEEASVHEQYANVAMHKVVTPCHSIDNSADFLPVRSEEILEQVDSFGNSKL